MKCDELKVQKIGDLCFDFKMGKNMEPDYYRKSEVDEAIADLKEKYEGVKNECNYWCNNLKVFAKRKKEEIKRIQEIATEQTFKLCVEKENVWQLEELLRKQKRKRCIAMAQRCNAVCFTSKIGWWRKWYKRWCDIADKLKENENV